MHKRQDIKNTSAITMADKETEQDQSKIKGWFKKIGLVGFLFFLIKGLVWLFIFFQAGKCALQ